MKTFNERLLASMQTLDIKICNSIEEAPDYNKDKSYKAALLAKALVVRKGMASGNDTVDLQIEAEDGTKFCILVTGRNLQLLASLVNQ